MGVMGAQPPSTEGLDGDLGPVTSTTLAEQVYVALREAIASRRLAPGLELTEVGLASRFGVSRSPIREAVQQLSRDQLVSRRPNGRYQVAMLSDHELKDLYAVRIVLESFGASEACRQMSPAQLDAIESVVREERQVAAHGDALELMSLGTHLHRLIAAASGNAPLESMVVLLLDRVRPFTLVSNTLPERRTTVLDEHGRLLDALSRREAKLAYDTMFEHLELSRDRLLRRYRNGLGSANLPATLGKGRFT